MTQNGNNVIILGGYGAAGKAIASLLGKSLSGTITLAGRSIVKAQQMVIRLESDAGFQANLRAELVDVSDEAQARQCSEGQDVVVVACDISSASIENLAKGCLTNKADYIDITPHPYKLPVFKKMRDLIEASESRFVLDAGADPGLPGWLARWLDERAAGNLREVVMYGRYRSTDIGLGGVADIIRASDRQGWIYDRSWRKSQFWNLRFKLFKGGFGTSLCVPVLLDELEFIPHELLLEKLRFYHAGLNPITNTLMMLEKAGVLDRIPFGFRQNAFYKALMTFTGRPFGLSLSAESLGSEPNRQVWIGHPDLYLATAIPAAIMCKLLVAKTNLVPGYGYLGQWAIQHKEFLAELQNEGYWYMEL